MSLLLVKRLGGQRKDLLRTPVSALYQWIL